MSERTIQAGNSIALRARFKNDLQNTEEASDVYVHVFPPEVDTTNLANALVVSGVPTYLGEGIFNYDYAVPNCGPDGTWTDLWEGDLACQSIAAILNFYVNTSGLVEPMENQLFANNIVQVTLASGIQAADGTYLEEEYNSEFLTDLSPLYSSVRKVRLEVGAFINKLPDFVVQLGILEASIEADALTFSNVIANNALYQHARREYTTCMASKVLLTNTGGLLLRSKTLADLSVTYDTQGVRDSMGRILDCIEQWQGQVMAGGGAISSRQPAMAIKGAGDPDRPDIGRLWESTQNTNDSGGHVPAGNIKGRRPGQRRSVTTYRRRKKTW